MAVWVIAVLVLAVGADRCPSLVCANISTALCAQATSDHSLLINNSPCPVNSYCSLNLLSHWANETLGTGVYACQPAANFTPGAFLLGFDPNSPCGIQETGKNLVQGYHPKVCHSDADCLLQDGTLSPCTCGANGLAYCMPHLSSRVYAKQWAQCEKNGGMLAPEVYAAWMAQYSMYPLMQQPAVCAQRLFYEYQYLNAAESAVSAGLWLSLPLLLLN